MGGFIENSAQPCGCDPGAGWTCKWHRDINDMWSENLAIEAQMREDAKRYYDLHHGTDMEADVNDAKGTADWKPVEVGFSLSYTPEDIERMNASIFTPTSAPPRKHYPLATGVLDYFGDALMEIAHVSFVGNEQHNPGQPVHWDRAKSTDEADALLRHLLERGTMDTDGLRHTAKVAWRALALLQKEIEQEGK